MYQSSFKSGLKLGRKKNRFKSCKEDRGLILISLLVTMVIFAILSAALLPITTSSFFNQVRASIGIRSYYLAEAGYRLAGSRFLHGGTGAGVATGDQREAQMEVLHLQTFTMNDLSSFKLEMYPYFYKTTAVPSGASTSLETKILGGFQAGRTIPAPGKLRVGATIYDYTSCTISIAPVTELATVTFVKSTPWPNTIAVNNTVLPVAVASGTQTVSRRDNINLSSDTAAAFPPYRGTFRVGTDTTVYAYWRKAGSTLQDVTVFSDKKQNFTMNIADGTAVVLLKYLELHSTATLGSSFMPTVREIVYRGPIAANFDDQGGGGGAPQAENVVDLQAMADASGATNVGIFKVVTLAGDDGGKPLNITKTTTGSGKGNQPTTEAYVSLPPGPDNPIYMSWNGAGSYLSYDIQVKIATGAGPDGQGWVPKAGSVPGHFDPATKPDTYCAGLLFRASEQSNQSIYYGLSIMRTHTGKGKSSDGITDGMLPNPYADDRYLDKAMVVFWTRNSNQANGDDNWLAYKLLDETGGSDFVVDSAAKIKDWSTIMARVVEAASLKLTVPSAPNVNVGDAITGGAGTAKVYKMINDSDGKVVLLLNNVEGTFTRPATVATTYTTDAGWGYRPRNNYIWAFYTDTSDHGSDATPLNNVHLGNPRGTLKWPVTDVPSWTATDDSFKLVQWNSNLNTTANGDPSLRLMGTGSELNAIIRTGRWTTGAYTLANFPPEIGVVSLGHTSVNTYFDDFGYYLRGAADGGGGDIGFMPPVQQ